MKRILFFILSVFQIASYSQQRTDNDSPLEYQWINVGDEGFSESYAYFANLAFSPSGQPWVAYISEEDSMRVSVMKFNGTTWEHIGQPGFSPGNAYYLDFAFNPVNGQPYVAFQDLTDTSRVTVMSYNGTSWEYVGNQGFSAKDARDISLAFSPSGQPHVAFYDFETTWKATVMKFDGIEWIYVGTQGLTYGQVAHTDLTFSPTGEPYLIFTDWTYSGKASVMKYDNNVWVYVGNPGFSADVAYYATIAFSESGQLYIAYQNVGGTDKASVMTYTGNNWIYVGNPDFSSQAPGYLSLAIDLSDQPYVAFRDHDTNPIGKATVMKFDGTDWVFVGNKGISTAMAIHPSIAFSPSGQIYVAYGDAALADKLTVLKYDSVNVDINEYKESILSFFPNPVKANLIINISNVPVGLKHIDIFNMMTQKVLEIQTHENMINVNIESYPIGIYIVRLKSGSISCYNKFCKN